VSPVARFDLSDQFWSDWLKNWLLYGSVYAINLPEPRVVPFDKLEFRERGGDWPDSLDAAWAEAVGAAKAKDRDLSLQGLQAYDRDWWIATAEARTADVCPACGRPREPAVSKADSATPAAALRAVIAALRAEA
jgi:hypothetical protein